MASDCVSRLLLSVVGGFEFGWEDVADGGVEPGGVPPVHPGQGGQLDVVDGAPRPLVADEFALVEADHRFGQGVVVRVTPGPDRGDRPFGRQPFGVDDGQVLPGFNRSSQHCLSGRA